MILVVGATGQLGSAVVRLLGQQGRAVRATVRPPDAGQDLVDAGAELVTADLCRPETLAGAVEGVRAIVATANAVAPTHPGDTPEAVEERGYAELITRAESAGVERFVYASVPATPLDEEVPAFRAKRRVEERLAASGLSWVSLRLSLFTEVWLALVGSSVPIRGEARPMTDRTFPFLRRFRQMTGRSVEDRGVLLSPGPASSRHAFISVRDVARALVAAVDATDLEGPVELGGPEVIAWSDVARIYEEVLSRRVRIVSMPAAVYAVGQRLLAPVAPAASNVMALNRMVAGVETDWDTADVAARLGLAPMRTVREVLREKTSAAVR